MSEVTLNVLGADGSIHGHLHGSNADRVLSSLGADPETIEELQIALGRFAEPDRCRSYFAGFRSGLDLEPWDAGIVCIDLVARRIAIRSTYSAALRQGTEQWDGPECEEEDRGFPFHLADDWVLRGKVDFFDDWSERDIAARKGVERLDERSVLYGRLPEVIVREIHKRQAELSRADQNARDRLLRDIHVDWMMASRADLGNRSPREVMIDDRHQHLMWDLQYQQHHWSVRRQPPPGIPRESAAYRFGGFGTHEIVMYYDLVRDMLYESALRFGKREVREADLPAQAEHLQKHRQDWLNTPDPEFHGRTPASIIDRERRRLPEVLHGEEAIVDPECPCCQMMADDELFGPAFWCLDGCEMDEDFAFSFHRTREEWEAEQRQYEEWSRECNERRRNHPEENSGDIPW